LTRPPISFFNATAPTELYTLSLHDALPIFRLCRGGYSDDAGRRGRAIDAAPDPLLRADHGGRGHRALAARLCRRALWLGRDAALDRKSTRLNSSHVKISYAVFCLKKKNREK